MKEFNIMAKFKENGNRWSSERKTMLSHQMICSSCGKPIFSDVTDENCRKVSQGLDEDGKPDTQINIVLWEVIS